LIDDDLHWRSDSRERSALEAAIFAPRAELPSDFELGRDDFVLLLGRVLEGAGSTPLGGEGAGVAVLNVMEARARTFDHLFVMGLGRGLFPRPVVEDPLLSDGLRRRLRAVLPDLPVKSEGHDEDRYLFAQLLSASPEVTLSCSVTDDDGKPHPVSPLVERLQSDGTVPEPVAIPSLYGVCAPAGADASRTPRPAHEHAILTGLYGSRKRFERVLRIALDEGAAKGPGTGRAEPLVLARSRCAVLAELDPPSSQPRDPGPYFGYTGGPPGATDTAAAETPYVTVLEGLAGCPWRTFLSRVLRLELPPDSLGELPGVEPVTLGSVVHHALERIALQALGEVPVDLDAAWRRDPVPVRWPDGETLEALVRSCAESVAREEGIALRGFERILAKRALARLEIARERDWSEPDAPVPVLGAELTASVALPDAHGQERTVRFRADRVDRSEDGLRLTDYKTGKPPDTQKTLSKREEHHHQRVARGEMLQATAYALAGGRYAPAQGRYLFLDPNTPEYACSLEVRSDDEAFAAAFESAVRTVLEVWDRGAFFPRLADAGRREGEGARSLWVVRDEGRLSARRLGGAAPARGLGGRGRRRRGRARPQSRRAGAPRRLEARGGGVTEDARATGLRRKDAEARRLAQQVFDRPYMLEAGAGTGKTAALVSRIAAWTLGEGWERAAAERRRPDGAAGLDHHVAARVLSGVVAITFTEAAAAEMATRVDAALRDVERGELPVGVVDDCLPAASLRRERARALRGALDYLEVHTIHAWCRRLLSLHPLEAQLHPRLEIDAEGRRQAEVVRDVLEARLREAYGEPGDPDFLALAEAEVGPREIEGEMCALLSEGVSAELLENDPLAPDRLEHLRDRLCESLQAVRAATGDCLDACGVPVAEAASARIRQTLTRLEEDPFWSRPELEAFLAWLGAQWADNEIERLGKWGRSDFGKKEKGVLGECAEALAEPAADLAGLLRHLGSLDLDRLDRGRRVMGGLLRVVEAQLRARGVLSFSALLTETAHLLASRPDAAARVRARVDQLLVDEFQDTDRRQCEIVRAVALEGPQSSRPGLFLVGDPKQSIYGWRSADLAAYDAFVRDVEEAGGLRRRLSVNYRSVPAVLDEIERIAAPLLVPREGVQPPFQVLVPSPENRDDGGFAAGRFAPVEFWLPETVDRDAGVRTSTLAAAAARIEAAALAREGRRRPLPQPRRLGHLSRCPARGGCAIRGGGGSQLLPAPRDHRRVCAGAQRARPQRLPLWRRGFPSLLTNLEDLSPDKCVELADGVRAAAASLPPDVPGCERVEGWENNLLAAIDALKELRYSARRDAPDVFVERLRTALLFEASEAARFLGPWRAANLERFFRELTQELCEGASRHAVLRRLRSAVRDAEVAEEATPREIVDDAVQMLTIHGAKGLDFEHVYVMQLHKGSGGAGAGRVPAAAVDGCMEYALFGAPTPGFDRVCQARDRVAQAENVRTLYVAMTRAKSRLVLSGRWPDPGRDGRGSHAGLLRARVLPAPDFDAELGRLVERGEADFFDAAAARWVFPSLSGEETPSARAAEAGDAALLGPAEVERDARHLRAERERAAAQRERRFAAAASDDGSRDWREQRADRGAGEAAPTASSAEVARAVGTAVHRVLEEFDLETEPEAEVERRRDALEGELSVLVEPENLEAAVANARSLLDAIVAGPLFPKLRSLAGSVVARELSVLAPPQADAGPAGYVSGTIDLLYRDPDSGELVVADYKTDRVPAEAALTEHGRAYAHQGDAYRRAVREALALGYTPRFELWYLRHGEIVKL
jgi:ATP-dependent helicase/nuclease subunit A